MLIRSINYALVFAFFTWFGFPATTQSQEADLALSHATALSLAFRSAAERAGPSVVTVRSKLNLNREDRTEAMNELLQDPRFRGLFPDGRPPFPLPGEGDAR